MRCRIRICLFAVGLALYAHWASAELPWDAALPECRQLDGTIQALVAKRRRGGSAAAMDRWKSQLRLVEREYRALQCHRIPRRYLRGRG
ncbi:MAG: hypothetical protein AAGG55_17150 [Pseudomonadota bacterium]